jgi:hypothetical protein
VTFLAEDAPALKNTLNLQAPVKVTDLVKQYQITSTGQAQQLLPLVKCGKNLVRTPVVEIDFGRKKGKLILSQLLTAGRLGQGFGEQGKWGIRYDPAAVQFVLNMMQECLQP